MLSLYIRVGEYRTYRTYTTLLVDYLSEMEWLTNILIQ
jgi:hypothetical protein